MGAKPSNIRVRNARLCLREFTVRSICGALILERIATEPTPCTWTSKRSIQVQWRVISMTEAGLDYLTSFQKRYGWRCQQSMSDYWEAVFETDPKVPDASHATPDWSLLNGLNSSVIRSRVQNTLFDASQLDDMNTNWISSSKSFIFCMVCRQIFCCLKNG